MGGSLGREMEVEKRVWLSQEKTRSTGHQKLPVWGLSAHCQHQASSLPYIPGLVSSWEERGSFGRLAWGGCSLGGKGEAAAGLGLTSLHRPGGPGQRAVFIPTNLTEIHGLGPPGKGAFAPSGLLPG